MSLHAIIIIKEPTTGERFAIKAPLADIAKLLETSEEGLTFERFKAVLQLSAALLRKAKREGKTMNNKDMMAAIAQLPYPDMLTESKITDPVGSNTYYSARTVVELLAKERQKCADQCDDVAAECNSWDDGGQDGNTAAMLCSSRIRAA